MKNSNAAPSKTELPPKVKRLPRYTSYPTALEFDGLDSHTSDEWLFGLPSDQPVSLYFHIPYCEKLCWFCGCFTAISNKYKPVENFLDLLKQEIRMRAAITGRLKVSHIHFGGGSPSMIKAEDFKSLIDVLNEYYDLDEIKEFAVEIDPRTVDKAKIRAYADVGVNRVSLGIQDFNEKTQIAINRVQSADLIHKTMTNFRDVGIDKINFDLIYGLPFQTICSLSKTIKQTIEFKPSRIALFGYAHVPHIKKHQKLIASKSLPGQQARQAQFDFATRKLGQYGYRSLGLDHFALEDDPLFDCFDNGQMKRNFQGYTDDTAQTLIGFGPSAISSLPDGYAQNFPMIRGYQQKISAGASPVVRGLKLSTDDKMFRDIISTLMCYFEVDPLKIAFLHGNDYQFEREIRELNKLVSEGILSLKAGTYKITKVGKPYLRAVATIFDQYFDQSSDIISRCIHESEG